MDAYVVSDRSLAGVAGGKLLSFASPLF